MLQRAQEAAEEIVPLLRSVERHAGEGGGAAVFAGCRRVAVARFVRASLLCERALPRLGLRETLEILDGTARLVFLPREHVGAVKAYYHAFRRAKKEHAVALAGAADEWRHTLRISVRFLDAVARRMNPQNEAVSSPDPLGVGARPELARRAEVVATFVATYNELVDGVPDGDGAVGYVVWVSAWALLELKAVRAYAFGNGLVARIVAARTLFHHLPFPVTPAPARLRDTAQEALQMCLDAVVGNDAPPPGADERARAAHVTWRTAKMLLERTEASLLAFEEGRRRQNRAAAAAVHP